MQIPPAPRTLGTLFVILNLLLAGCTTAGGGRAESISTQSAPHPHIIALVDGSPITNAQIRDDLSERAGREALADFVLDRQLETELNQRGTRITREDLQSEKLLFLRALTGTDPAQVDFKLVESIRATKGLGPDRYPRFLRRNAMLRALVRDDATPSEAEYLLAQQIAFGSKYRIRLFVNTDQATVVELRKRVLDAKPDARRWIFADACTTDSIHPSADRGGLIPELNINDPSYPSVLADAIRAAETASLSGVLATDAGFALVLVESISPPTSPTDDQIRSLREQLALRKQRLAMQRLAVDLIAQAQISVTDKSLNWAWTATR